MVFRPTLRQLEYVVAVHDLRHFGQAARQCHVSQPTLSVQVSLVEQGLGMPLFERTSSQVVPTPSGEKLARGARLLMTSLNDLLDDLSSQAAALGGMIRLGTPATLGPYFLPRLLRGLHERYPTLQVYVREDSPAALEEAVLEGSLDCGLGPTPERAGLSFRRVGREAIYLGVPTDHILATGESVRLADLRGEKLLALGRGHRLLENVRHLAQASGAHIVENFEGTSLDAIRQMVSIGMGLSLFPELYARAEFRQSDDVKLLEFGDWSERRDVGFYWREGSGRARHYLMLADAADGVAAQLGIGI
ncbi:hyaluronan synthase (plasmid) [Aureimonas sp. SA4125]|uniref:hydrogen peroxide-inducible genes activator n=1 Tax=Aureimonas sp. SA4125 TaxID=2826993 RepID=UPI001CC377A5|nr:hydrogen peroxide-inducible genes activator [Aureimonas sp. SA4125]BDA87270.1 hyaluronan synthase [Aureimonas sp. SA4125]